MKTLIVNDKFDNKKLIYCLEKTFHNVNKNVLFKALRKKDIRINNVKISENVIIHKNDKITLYIPDKYFSPLNSNFNIIYEDDNILIINKPKNIEVTGEDSITSNMQKSGLNVYPCHRLDRNTKGLVLFAKNEETLNILLKKFKNKEITKFYKCKVYGLFNKKSDILKAYLFKDNKKALVYISDIKKKGYKEIITEYKVLEEDSLSNTSTLEIILHTGRTHQIRAHLAHVNHPIIGDGKYGNYVVNKKFNKNTQNLCAYKLKFNFKTDSGILNYLNGYTYMI